MGTERLLRIPSLTARKAECPTGCGTGRLAEKSVRGLARWLSRQRNLLYKSDGQSCSPRTPVKVEGEDRPAAVPSGLPTSAMAL